MKINLLDRFIILGRSWSQDIPKIWKLCIFLKEESFCSYRVTITAWSIPTKSLRLPCECYSFRMKSFFDPQTHFHFFFSPFLFIWCPLCWLNLELYVNDRAFHIDFLLDCCRHDRNIWSSHGGGYEDYCLLGFGAM
jgi:hypothetical protein